MFTQIIMGNITLTIPDVLHEKLRSHFEIRWSEVVRQLLQKKIEQLELMNSLTNRSKLTQNDVDEISKKIDFNVVKRLGLK